MASGEPTQDAPGLHATRQMLDDLDALMERMLALPINETDDAASAPAIAAPVAPPAAPPASPHAAAMTAKLTLLEMPVEDPPLDGAHAGTNPSHLPALNAVRPPDKPRVATLPPLPQAPRVAPAPLSDHVVPPTEQPTVESLWAEVPEADDSFVSWFIVPLLWGNRAFDRATLYLGPPGALLRSATGRALLGMMGLLLLVAAGLWLLRDW